MNSRLEALAIQVQALSSSANMGPSTPEDGTTANYISQGTSLTRKVLDTLYGSASALTKAINDIARRPEVHPVKPGESIQVAVDSAAGRYPVRLLTGTHRVTSIVNVPSGTVIEGEPGTVLDLSAAPDGGAFRVSGSLGGSHMLSADALTGAFSFTTANPIPNLAVGDYVKIASDKPYGLTNQKYGELARVTSISGTTVTLEDALTLSYVMVNSPTVTRIAMAEDISFRNLQFKGSDVVNKGTVAFNVTRAYNVRFQNISTDNVQQAGIYITDSVSVDFLSCSFNDVIRPGFGYGIGVLYACQDISITNCFGRKLRHLVTVGGGSGAGIPRRVSVNGCVASQLDEAGFDVHPAGEQISFTGCHVKGSSVDGFVLQGGSVTVTGCLIEDVARYGIFVQPLTVRGVQATISGNDIRLVSSYAIKLSTSSSWTGSGNFTCSGNSIYACGWGIDADSSTTTSAEYIGVSITGNVIFTNNGSGVTVKNIPSSTVTGNRIRIQASGYHGIDLINSPRSVIVGNAIDGRSLAARCINIAQSDNSAVTGNSMYRAPIGVYLDDASNIAYSGNANTCATRLRQGGTANPNI